MTRCGWVKVFEESIWHYFTGDESARGVASLCGTVTLFSLPILMDQKDDGRGNCAHCRQIKESRHTLGEKMERAV